MTTSPPERTPRQIAEEDAGGRMSFFEHLVELRQRIVSSLIGDWDWRGGRYHDFEAFHQLHHGADAEGADSRIIWTRISTTRTPQAT